MIRVDRMITGVPNVIAGTIASVYDYKSKKNNHIFKSQMDEKHLIEKDKMHNTFVADCSIKLSGVDNQECKKKYDNYGDELNSIRSKLLNKKELESVSSSKKNSFIESLHK